MALKWTPRLTAPVPAHLQLPGATNGRMALDNAQSAVVIRVVAPTKPAPAKPAAAPTRRVLALGRRDMRWYYVKGEAYYDECYDDNGVEWRYAK